MNRPYRCLWVLLLLAPLLLGGAASRENARNPLVTSGKRVPEASRTTHEPTRCRIRLAVEKWGT